MNPEPRPTVEIQAMSWSGRSYWPRSRPRLQRPGVPGGFAATNRAELGPASVEGGLSPLRLGQPA
jgi:hypothetical protein